MFFHLKLILIAIMLLICYELAIYKPDLVFWILGSLLLLSGAFVYKMTKRKRNILLPLLFLAGSEILLFFISGMLFTQIYIIVSTAVFYLIILGVYRLDAYSKDETAHKINLVTALSVVFIWGAGLFAVFLNLNIPPVVISLVFYLVVALTTHQLFLVNIKKKNFHYLLNSLTIAYCVTIFCLAAFLLPFGYLTLSVLILASYFVAVNYIIKKNQTEFLKHPTCSIAIDVIIFILAIGTTLITTRWSILE